MKLLCSSAVLFRILAAVMASLDVAAVAAQPIPGLPRVSQKAQVTQTIGITEVTISYHRPAVKGRRIWGSLVPYGLIWRAGANDNTTLRVTHPVKIEGHDLAAGTYSLHMIPTEETWTVIFNRNTNLWGSFGYDEALDALRVQTRPHKAPFQESLSYFFDDLTLEGATLRLRWEELEVPLKLEVDTNALVRAKIEAQLQSVPETSWEAWNSAANYYLTVDSHHAQALQWIDHALSIEENFQNLRVKGLLLRQLGDIEKSDEFLSRALASGNRSEINVLGYYFALNGELDKAIEVFGENVARHPDSWLAHASLGEARAARGQTEESKISYAKALELAPARAKPRVAEMLERLASQSGPRPVHVFWFG